jgi:hypothetical protein
MLLLALPTNIRLGWKCKAVIKALAYYICLLTTLVRSFNIKTLVIHLAEIGRLGVNLRSLLVEYLSRT